MASPPANDVKRRRRGLLAIGVLALAWALLIQAQGWAQISNFALVRSLSHGTAKIDRYHWETRDESYYRGHYYSVKAPGLAFLTLPAYEALQTLEFEHVSRSAARTARDSGAGRWAQGKPPQALYGGDPERSFRVRRGIEGATVFVWALGLVGNVLPAFLLLLLVRAVAERVERGFGTAAALTLGLGTLVMPFATLFFSHVVSALLGFAAFAVLLRERDGPQRLTLVAAAGLLAGLAVTTEYPLAIVAAIVGVYALARAPRVRRALAYGAGAAAGVLPLLLYNLWAFGSVTHFSYHDAVSFQGTSGHDVLGLNDQGFFGISAPSPSNALELLFAAKGLLVLSPVLALGALGGVLLYRRGRRAEALVIGAVGSAYLLYNSGYYLPFGGGSPGPRFLIPALPFLSVPLAIAYRRFPVTTVALAVPSVLLTIAATTTLPLIGNDDIGAWAHLVKAGIFEHTIVSVLGGDDSWGAIAPVLAALAAAVALGFTATPRRARPRERGLPLLALAAWIGAATIGLVALSGSEAPSDRAFSLLAAVTIASLGAVTAVTRLRPAVLAPAEPYPVDDELAAVLARDGDPRERAARCILPGGAASQPAMQHDGSHAERAQPLDGRAVRESRHGAGEVDEEGRLEAPAPVDDPRKPVR
jgi:hypothetical protein